MEDSRQEELEEEVNATTGSFICEICVESVSKNKKFKTKNHCVHHFCVNCIAKYIETKITENTVKIKCPGLDCQQVLDPISCREIIPQSIFSKWCDVLCDNYILGFERSYCPNRNCRELVVNECGENLKKSKCPYCEELFCFECKVAWHAGYGCEEGRNMRDGNDILFGQLVEKRAWIRCPGCGHCIEHRDGCFVITCRF
ncbi:probable E3 ubiquitin-protein ligase RNF217 [Pistacia vera]|uniref:probable E3 ubiquitin-protein ligase RNF217 n=1 Tax=Pistacia vera TaxID=55513 RepID=UPI0012636D4D|nr:probable E3 ubiquitin-protein ligase RNF217 [Pistacia vera]